jgi:hypothetical protein
MKEQSKLTLEKPDLKFSLQPEDGGSKVIRNSGILPQHYKASQPRRPRLVLRETSNGCVNGTGLK